MQIPNELPSTTASMANNTINQQYIEGMDNMQVDNKTSTEMNRLIELKKEAVENEDYEEAKKLKLKIDRFKLVVNQIHELEIEKVRAVNTED
jgi:hypothetical protein